MSPDEEEQPAAAPSEAAPAETVAPAPAAAAPPAPAEAAPPVSVEPGAPRPPGDGASIGARQERPRRFESSRGDRDGDRGDDRDRRGGNGGGGGGRRYFGRRKVCTFCVDKATSVDYKDPAKLRRFVSDRGRIEGRRRTGTCARHQRWLATALKRARHLALLPYAPEHIRLTGAFASRR